MEISGLRERFGKPAGRKRIEVDRRSAFGEEVSEDLARDGGEEDAVAEMAAGRVNVLEAGKKT